VFDHPTLEALAAWVVFVRGDHGPVVDPLAGRLADLWGTRRLFMGALVVFSFGSALAGASQTMDQLIAARLVQAIGGGVLVPVGTAAAWSPLAAAAPCSAWPPVMAAGVVLVAAVDVVAMVSTGGLLEPMRPRQSDTKVVEARVLPGLGRRL
jgi:MFS family permease